MAIQHFIDRLGAGPKREPVIRLRLVALAAVPLLLGAAPHPSEQAKAKESAAESERADGPKPIAVTIAAPVQVVQPAIKQPTCGPGQYQGRDDLCAQWKAADAAGDAAKWAFVSIFVSLIGLAGVFVTFRETRRTAKAAEDALKLDRAWLTPVNVECSIITDDGGEKIQSMVRWRNTGRSPALKAIASGRAEIVDKDAPAVEMERIDPDGQPFATVGAGDEMFGPMIRVGEIGTPQILAHEKDLHVYARIEYEDVFHPGITRVSEAYYVAYVMRAPDGRVVTQAQPRGLQNRVT